MTGLDIIGLRVGTSAANMLLQRTLKVAGARLRPDLTLDEVLVRELPHPINRRRIQRQFQDIADAIAEHLEPFLVTEFGHVEGNEIMASAEAVATTFDKAGFDGAVMLSADLDATKLEQCLRSACPTAAADALLNEVGSLVYDLTLREACNYVVEVCALLPNAEFSVFREILRRQTELQEAVNHVLDRLSERGTTALLGGTEAELFERQYRREVARKLDKLELFGVSFDPMHRRYALSVAYISLSVRETGSSQGGLDLRVPATQLPVEHALSRGSRHLIRGEAGSGKTTLMRWLAVNAAGGTLGGPLQGWNSFVPFLIRLRSYATAALPTPSELVSLLAPLLGGEEPHGWARMKLETGRALVLIDGVDELPKARREEVREWMAELCSIFPAATYVVTTRPPAIDEAWLSSADLAFSNLELQPMTPAEARLFIDHWHQSVAREVDTPHRPAVLEDGEALKTKLDVQQHLRSFVQNPLLCAMLCALHRERKASLPTFKIQLYEVALDALLTRRDPEREISESGLALDHTDKVTVLRGLAWWLLANNRADLAEDVARGLVDRRLAALPHTEARGDAVLTYLIERSGVLRQPAHGVVDFHHKTFQEYFAATELLAQDLIELLVANASDDAWRQVLVSAAGLATGNAANRLMGGLLARAKAEPMDGRLRLVIIECFESMRELDPGLVETINQVVYELIPPRTLDAARALATVGDDLIPRLLPYACADDEAVAEFCVRCLIDIGTDAAMVALRSFARDGRDRVVRALVEGWSRFDPDVFAAGVLAHSPLENGALELFDPVLASAAARLDNLVDLRCEAEAMSDAALTALAARDVLTELRVDELPETESLEVIDIHSGLSTLRIGSGPIVKELWTTPKDKLQRLSLRAVPNLRTSLGQLRRLCPDLRELELGGLEEVVDLGMLEGLSAMERLTLSGLTSLRDASGLRSCAGLESIQLSGLPALNGLPPLDQLDRLCRVEITACSGVRSVDFVAKRYALEALILQGCGVSALEPLADLTALRDLALRGCSAVSDLGPISRLGGLERLDISATSVRSLSELTDTQLLELRCDRTNIRDLAPISAMPRLEGLSLNGCGLVADVAVLSGSRSLKWLELTGVSPHMQIDGLAELPNLEDLAIDRNVLGGHAVDVLSGLPRLTRLQVYGTAEMGGVEMSDLSVLVEAGVTITPYAAPPL